MADGNYTPPMEMPERRAYPVLEGQTALVTGASKGIGEGIARQLARAGADVVLNYHSDRKGAESLREEIQGLGRKAWIFQADVSREPEVEALFLFAREQAGRTDILINNSGIQLNAPFHRMSLSQWQRVMDVNLTGQFLCARRAVNAFLEQGIDPAVSCARGKIICISSVHDVIPWAGHVNYAAAKGGVMLMMKSLAQEAAPLKIRVNSISPGAIRTPMNLEKLTTPEEYQALLTMIPYGRLGESEDVGRAAVWLASDDSDYIHGTTLYVDGGMTLYPEFARGG